MNHNDFAHVWKRYKRASFWIPIPVITKVPYVFGLSVLLVSPSDEGASRGLQLMLFLASCVSFISVIFAVIFFLRWLGPVLQNARKLNESVKVAGAGWADFCWFIPIVNIFAPYLVLAPLLTGLQETQRERAKLELKFWAIAFAFLLPPLSFILPVIAARIWWDSYGTYWVMECLSIVPAAIAASLMIRFMRTVTNDQNRKFAEREPESSLLQLPQSEVISEQSIDISERIKDDSVPKLYE